MSQSQKCCRNCGVEIDQNSAPGILVCPACAAKAGTEAYSGGMDPARRKELWSRFWLWFIFTPIIGIFTIPLFGLGLLLLPAGAALAGHQLAKLFEKEGQNILGRTVLITLGILAIYAAVVFAGCAIIMSGFKS